MARRASVILLVLLTLAPSMVKASAWYRCAHDGELRAACCCPPQAKHHGTSRATAPELPHAAVRQACCCTVTQLAAREASDRATPPVALAVMPALAATAAPPLPSLELRVVVATSAPPRVQRGPPEPLFARHCSLRL